MKNFFLLALIGCLFGYTHPTASAQAADAKVANRITIDKVFFAQQHVLAPDDPLFKLVSELEALIKVQVYSENAEESPFVFATLKLGSKTKAIRLHGPKTLPKRPKGNPLLMKQSYDDSFTAIIPAEWIRPGLNVTVELRRYDYGRRVAERGIAVLDSREFKSLRIGAPNRITLTMYDIHYFGGGVGQDYPEGWFKEFESKLPTAGIELRRVRDIRFTTMVMPPRGGKPATRCSSREEYKTKTGMPFDGEQGIALIWNAALRKACGTMNNGLGHTYINIYGVWAGGEAWGFHGVGAGRSAGILLHEFGHTFHLPDGWLPETGFPYRGDMHGIKTSWKNSPHVGPAWAFDLHKRVFIPPTVQANAVRGKQGIWKRDPMSGGGQGDQEQTHMFRFFADFSVSKMRDFMEENGTYWNETLGAYVRWDAEKGAYSKAVDATDEVLPVERGVKVYSILASISGATPEANYVYPPIGPYKANLIPLFDPASTKEREAAAALFAKQRAFGEVNRYRGLVDHANWKWIGGADRGIAAAKEKLKVAKTEAERNAAQLQLVKWQKNRQDGIEARSQRQAALDRALAKGPEWRKEKLASARKCNVCLKVTQGGKTRLYLLPVSVSSKANPTSPGSHHHAAINVPARDGAITQVELLHVPDVFTKGLPAKPVVLEQWKSE